MSTSQLVTIALATDDDCTALARAHAACFQAAWSAQEFHAHLSQPTGLALTASAIGTDDIVGVMLVRVVADEAEILTFGMHPGHRRQGIATDMLAELEPLIAARGARHLHLEVAVDNAAAIALYRAAGFAESGRRKGYYVRRGQAAVDAVVLSKPV